MDSAIRQLADRISSRKTIHFDLDEKKGRIRYYRSQKRRTFPVDITEEPGGTFEVQDGLRGVILCGATMDDAEGYLVEVARKRR